MYLILVLTIDVFHRADVHPAAHVGAITCPNLVCI
jgi:hypothetical protein